MHNTVPLNTVLTTIASTTAPGSNCPSGSTDPRCTVTVTVLTPGLTIVKTANATAAVPGPTVGYTITVTDSGQTPYTGAVVTDDLTGCWATRPTTVTRPRPRAPCPTPARS